LAAFLAAEERSLERLLVEGEADLLLLGLSHEVRGGVHPLDPPELTEREGVEALGLALPEASTSSRNLAMSPCMAPRPWPW